MKQLDSHPSAPQRPTSSQRPYSSLLLRGGLGIFFALQIWAVLAYYWSDHPWDERFAWRMFSTVRGLKCEYQVWRGREGGDVSCPDASSTQCERVLLGREQHMVWVNLMRRGRLSVLDQLARSECSTQGEGARFFVKLTCPAPTPPHKPVRVQSEQVNLCINPQKRSISDVSQRLSPIWMSEESSMIAQTSK